MNKKTKKLIGVTILLCAAAIVIFFLNAKTASQKTEGEQETKGMIFSSVSVSPDKIKVGDIQTTTVSLESDAGIRSVVAQIPFEGSYDEIALKLISGDDKKGTWEGKWTCHNTLTKEYTTKIIAIDKNNKTAETTSKWWDDTNTAWYDQNWTNRKMLTVHENSGSPLIDYQVPVDLTSAFYNNTGLIGSWHFNEGSGSVARDSSGNVNHGTISGATWATDRRGRAASALSFNGVDQYVELPDATALKPTTFTVSAWVRFNSLSNNQQIVNLHWNDVSLRVVGSKLKGVIYGGTDAIGATTLSINTWYFITQKYDGINNKVYLNGTEDGTIASVGVAWETGTHYPTFGIGSTNYLLPFNGYLDEVSIYNRALSATEIAALYAEGKSRPDLDDLRFTAADGKTLLPYWIENDSKAWVKIPTLTGSADTNIYYYYGNKNATSASSDTNTFVRVVSGLVGGWDFSEGSGGTAYDRSGNRNTGAIDATYTADRMGNANRALSFNGSYNFVSLPVGASVKNQAAASVSMWVNFSSFTQDYVTYYESTGSAGQGNTRFSIVENSDGSLYGRRRDTDASSGTNTGNSQILNTGTWYYITLTATTTAMNLYINDSAVTPDATTRGSFANTSPADPIGVGAYTFPGSFRFFTGYIDDVARYNRALSAAEISDLYNANYTTLFAPNETLIRKYNSNAPTLPATGPEESKPNETGVGASGGVLMF